MKLILTQDVDNVGNEGDVVDVKPGFGRNFLIPQKLAITFSKSQLKQVEEKRSQEDRKIDRQKDVLLDLLSKVADLDITIKMNSEDGAKLFGSVTKLDIEKLLIANDIVFDKKYIAKLAYNCSMYFLLRVARIFYVLELYCKGEGDLLTLQEQQPDMHNPLF